MSSSVFADIVTSQTFWSHLGAPRAQLLLHSKTFYKLDQKKEKGLGSTWKEHIRLQTKISFRERSLQEQNIHVIRAMATLEVGSEDDLRHDSSLQINSVPGFQVQQPSTEDTPEIDEREKLRRLKISKANKGQVPWNKGKKHSAEILRKIRERTRTAMQDPKVRMKLSKRRGVRSEETRRKIGAGLREHFRRQREMLLAQETYIIAEASRKGHGSNEELHWDSYETLDEQLEKEGLESIKKRETIPRVKGAKRAPKSLNKEERSERQTLQSGQTQFL